MHDAHGLKAVLFDNDGTLVDSHDLLLECFRFATSEVLGAALPDETVMAKVGQPLAVQAMDFSPDPAVQKRIVDAYRAHNAEIHDSWLKAFPGMVGALRALEEEGFALGVVTSKMHGVAWHGLELLGASPYLRCLVGSDDCEHHKPDPEPVTLGYRFLGVAPEECLYVGDSPYDLMAGSAAGCLTAGVTWGMFPEERLAAESPTLMCSTFEDLLEKVLALR